MKSVNFSQLNKKLLHRSRILVPQWLPGGTVSGREWVALNPNRVDRNRGSFRINLDSGRWADFATNDKGGDLISLYAFLNKLTQRQAAAELEVRNG